MSFAPGIRIACGRVVAAPGHHRHEGFRESPIASRAHRYSIPVVQVVGRVQMIIAEMMDSGHQKELDTCPLAESDGARALYSQGC